VAHRYEIRKPFFTFDFLTTTTYTLLAVAYLHYPWEITTQILGTHNFICFTMRKLYFTGISLIMLCSFAATAQDLSSKHNPKMDVNLSPNANPRINPNSNSSINPKFNWNINPIHTTSLNPIYNSAINPMNNQGYNPFVNNTINPMYQNSLHPKNPTWKGLYMYDSTDNLIGYVSVASQDVMLYFDTTSEWTGYFVRANKTMFNFFDTKGVWTGIFLCFDSVSGYNVFDKEGVWNGKHIK